MRIRGRHLSLGTLVLVLAACSSSNHDGGAGPADGSASPGSPGSTAANNDDPPKTFELSAIDAWIGRRVKSLNLVGLSVAIARDGKIVLSKGYGKRTAAPDGPGVDTQTSFAIGSVTKQLTCAATLALAEDGRLTLEDKVGKYYPELTRANDITISDMLHHVSGYTDFYPLDFVDERFTKTTTPDNVMKDYASPPRALDFEPKSAWSYSNTGFVVAGRIIEKVSGEPFGQFVQKRIFTPLMMTRSSLSPRDLGANVATGHTAFMLGDTEVATPEGDGWVGAAGAAYASAEDLARWDIGLADRTVLKQQSSYEVMTTPQKLSTGVPTTYACGLVVSHDGPDTYYQHGGAVSGFLAFNAIVPRTRSAVVVLSNADHIDPGSIHGTITSLLLKADHPRRTITVTGVPAQDAAKDLFRQMQKGTVDRSKLGDLYNKWLTDQRIKSASSRLSALGDPEIEVEALSERGGAENASLRLKFKSQSIRATLHRSPDGRVQQFLLYKH